MSELKVVVRTWKHNRQGVYHLLKGVHCPFHVVERIQQWAANNQLNLLHRKYCEHPSTPLLPGGKSAEAPCSQVALNALNQLWRDLQGEGFNTEDDRHAITFLFDMYQDNPELINLEVTQTFFAELDQGKQTA